MNPARRDRRIARAAVALLAALGASAVLVVGREAPVRAAPALTLETIAIDGGFADWDAVLANALQTTHDGDGSSDALALDCSLSTDRDCPQSGGAGNDFLTFAWTYDASYVYLYIERYGSTNNGVDFLFAADVDRDLRLTSGADVVVHADWNGTTRAVTLDLWRYDPADDVNGDPVACVPAVPGGLCPNGAVPPVPAAPEGYVDGYKLPGTNVSRNFRACTGCAGQGSPDGRRAEIRLPWAAFGVTAEQPFYWHTVSSNNDFLASSVDNIGAPNGKLGSFTHRAVSLAPDRSGAVASPGQATYLHTLRNEGNDVDRFELAATSSQGAQLELLDAGVVIATDATGDGTWDAVLAGRDANGDGRPDVSLAADAAQDLSLRITVPAGRSGVDLTRLTAASAWEPGVSASVVDTSQIGTAALVPAAQARLTIAAQPLPFRLELRNAQGVPETFGLAAAATCTLDGAPAAVPLRLELALDSDGDPGAVVAVDETGDGTWDTVEPAADSDGDLVPDLGQLGAGSGRYLHLVATPPGGTATGTACTAVLGATGAGTGASATARLALSVAEKVTFGPSYVGAQRGARDAEDAQVAVGASVFLPATLVNAEATARAYDLAVLLAGPAVGGAARVWSDPDGDGNPSDGEVITTTPGTVQPWGGAAHVVVEVSAAGVAAGNLAQWSVTARAVVGGAEATQVSEVVVGYVAAFADALHTDAASAFAPCSTVYVGGRGLSPGDVTRYTLDWAPPEGAPPLEPDPDVHPWATTAIGTADAALALPADAALGAWTARLLEDGVQKDQVRFSVERAGTIPSLTTDRTRYRPGDAVTVAAALSNGGATALRGSTLVYARSGAALRTLAGVDLLPGQTFADAFAFTLPAAEAPGTKTLTLGWQLSCGSAPFVVRDASFDVAPSPPGITAPSDGALVGLPDLFAGQVRFAGTADPGATVAIAIDGLAAGTDVADALGGWAIDAGVAEGAHEVAAIQTVSAVASDASLAVSFTLDTIPPGAPAIEAPLGGAITNAASVAVSGSALDPEAVRVQLLADGALQDTVLVASGAFVGAVALGEGDWDLTARALDAAGNPSAESAAVALTVDRTAPAAPTWSAPSPTALAMVPVSGTTEPGADVEILEGGAVLATTAADALGTFRVEVALAEAVHPLSVRVTDAAGNPATAGPADVVVDRTDPAAPAVGAPADGSILGAGDLVGGKVSFSGSTEPFALVEIEIDGVAAGTAVADAAGAWSLAAAVAAGEHTVRARATDEAGNASDQGVASGFTLDVDQPAPPVLASPGAALSTNVSALPVSGTAEPHAQVRLLLDGEVVATLDADDLGAFQGDLPLPAADVEAELTAIAVDAGGNPSAASAGVTITVDRTDPAAPTFDAADGAVFAPGEVELRGNAEPGSVVAVTAAGTTVTATAAADGGWAVTVTLPEGTHTVTAEATDAAGNTSPPAAISVVARTDGGGGGGGCGCRTGAGGGAPALLALAGLLALAPRGRRRTS